jgi:hypothetical protein
MNAGEPSRLDRPEIAPIKEFIPKLIPFKKLIG